MYEMADKAINIRELKKLKRSKMIEQEPLREEIADMVRRVRNSAERRGRWVYEARLVTLRATLARLQAEVEAIDRMVESK